MKHVLTRRFGFALAGALIALIAGGLAAAQGPGGPGMGPGFGEHRPPMERAFRFDGTRGQFWNNPKIVERLKLTDDQRKAMDGILQQHRMTLIDLRANVEKAELQMEPLMRADDPNENAILAQIDKIAQARAELEKANARFLLALRGKLTPDQWKQVQQFREDRGPGRPDWGRDGEGPGRGFHRQGPPPPSDGQPGAPGQAPGSGSGQGSGPGEL
ncbi:MAG TPA: Spy/CpxP family protein refolding chaperone [Terracidiphilus sp.]|jgi:protein CpxP|nr:Spy/CpxP family protein refolding chaperone [Terracidiphilus sp.]